MEDNANLHNEVEQIKKDYKQKEIDVEWKYKSKINGLEKENNILLDPQEQIKKEDREKEWDLER